MSRARVTWWGEWKWRVWYKKGEAMRKNCLETRRGAIRFRGGTTSKAGRGGGARERKSMRARSSSGNDASEGDILVGAT